MSLNTGETILSSDILALKTRVKNECVRRNKTNSLNISPYNTNFSISANASDLAKLAHYNETAGYINLIQNTDTTSNLINSLKNVNAKIDVVSAINLQVNAESCVSATCRGACYTNCSGGCRSGCTSSCGSGCSTGCTGSCATDCTGSCGGDCRGGCTHVCAMECTRNNSY